VEDALDRLILDRVITEENLSQEKLEISLYELGTAFDGSNLQERLTTLKERGVLEQTGNAWQLADHSPAQIQRLKLSDDELAEFTKHTREVSPFFIEVRHFLNKADLDVKPVSPFGFVCTSSSRFWGNISPFYIQLISERTLDMAAFQDLCEDTKSVFDGELKGHIVVIVIDRKPDIGSLHQIFALRAQEGLTVVPLPRSSMVQALLDSNEATILREQINLYRGEEDLYDLRNAVTDVLSFFGRSTILNTLQNQLTSGRSAMIFGMRKIGKSSLLGRLREECNWPVAVVDLEGYDGGLRYVYDEVLRSWRTALKTMFPELPLPEWKASDTSDQAMQAESFRRNVEELLNLLADQSEGMGLLLFLDEIDILLSQADYRQFAALLRQIAETPRWKRRFALLMAGLNPALNRVDQLEKERNPFYSFFIEGSIGPLEPEDARLMIVSIGSQMGIGYTEEALNLLIEAGGGHPFLIRQLCSQAIRDLTPPKILDTIHIEKVIEKYLQYSENYLAESLWKEIEDKSLFEQAILLKSLALTQPQADETLNPPDLPLDERQARQQALNQLQDQSLIHQKEDGWELTIPLYRRWIRRHILNLPDKI
jgi:hypothetical protein